MFEKCQHAQPAGLLSPGRRNFSLKSARIPAKKLLASGPKSLAAGHIANFQTSPNKMEIYEVILVDLNTNESLSAQVEVDEAETTENISIHAVIDKQDVTSSDYNYFPAFQIFRDKLLELGYGIKCNGSRINAIQSGMMGGTDEIYLVEAGKQALMENIVRIWDYTDIDTFPDTKQQLDFLKQWTPY